MTTGVIPSHMGLGPNLVFVMFNPKGYKEVWKKGRRMMNWMVDSLDFQLTKKDSANQLVIFPNYTN